MPGRRSSGYSTLNWGCSGNLQCLLWSSLPIPQHMTSDEEEKRFEVHLTVTCTIKKEVLYSSETNLANYNMQNEKAMHWFIYIHINTCAHSPHWSWWWRCRRLWNIGLLLNIDTAGIPRKLCVPVLVQTLIMTTLQFKLKFNLVYFESIHRNWARI